MGKYKIASAVAVPLFESASAVRVGGGIDVGEGRIQSVAVGKGVSVFLGVGEMVNVGVIVEVGTVVDVKVAVGARIAV